MSKLLPANQYYVPVDADKLPVPTPIYERANITQRDFGQLRGAVLGLLNIIYAEHKDTHIRQQIALVRKILAEAK